MNKFYFLNGEILPAADTKLHISDLGILRGVGIFDFFRTCRGKPVFIEDYIARFIRSAKGFNFSHPYQSDRIVEEVHRLIALNGFAESGIKLVMTGGFSDNGFDPGDPNFIILVDEFIPPNPEYFKNGVKLITHRHVREFPHVKSTNYLTALMMAPRCKALGAIDVLYHDGTCISEVSRSNFFIVKDGKVITPGDNILMGITRGKTLELAKKHYPVAERRVELSEIFKADEAFITSSTKRLMPVIDIDGSTIGDGRPGKTTKHLEALFTELERDYIDLNSR